MQYIDLVDLAKTIKRFIKVYNEYVESGIYYEIWEDNYRDEGENDWNPYEQELDLEKLASAFHALSKKSCSQLIALASNKDIKVLKELYSEIADLWSECSKGSNIITFIKESITPTDDLHRTNNAINYAKLGVLLDFPYFDPDNWIDNHIKINPIVLSLNSKLPKEIENRLNEATFSYIYGFYNSSTALCRSVLEGLLRDKLRNEIPCVDKWTLNEMLKWLEKKSNKERTVAWNVKKVRKKANDILHNLREKMTRDQAKNVLLDTRKLLEEII